MNDEARAGSPAGESSSGRYVHLGERLQVIGRIRDGLVTIEAAAEELGVTPAEIASWQRRHRNDRIIGIDELRAGSPQQLRLMRRVEMLAGLVSDCERQIRQLHQELIEASKQFGENHTPREAGVARMQPRAA